MISFFRVSGVPQKGEARTPLTRKKEITMTTSSHKDTVAGTVTVTVTVTVTGAGADTDTDTGTVADTVTVADTALTLVDVAGGRGRFSATLSG